LNETPDILKSPAGGQLTVLGSGEQYLTRKEMKMKFTTPLEETTPLTVFKKLTWRDFQGLSIQQFTTSLTSWKKNLPEFVTLFKALEVQLLKEHFAPQTITSWECPMWGEGENYTTIICFQTPEDETFDVVISLENKTWQMEISALDESFCEVSEDFGSVREVITAYTAYTKKS